MRALVIEESPEAMEREDLAAEATPGWQGGFDLGGEVHALVATGLLRLAGVDALEANAEAHPPGREA